jgi:hypothetical protein
MPGLSFARIITDCELLSSNLTDYLTEFPHLEPDAEQLSGFINESRGLAGEQEKLRGRLRQITRLRQEAEIRSRDLRSRIAAQLRGKLGFENERLLELGIPARKLSKRSRAALAKPPVVKDHPQEAAAPGDAGAVTPSVSEP